MKFPKVRKVKGVRPTVNWTIPALQPNSNTPITAPPPQANLNFPPSTGEAGNRPVQLSDLQFIVQEMSQTVTKTVTESVLQLVREPQAVSGKTQKKAAVSNKVKKVTEKERDAVRDRLKVSVSHPPQANCSPWVIDATPQIDSGTYQNHPGQRHYPSPTAVG